jgi:hypothetical protein
VFSKVGHVQLGVNVPAALAGNSTQFTFDLDKVSLVAPVPEPTTIFTSAIAAVTLLFWPRRMIGPCK